jgi:hypothetical protein
VRQFHRYSIKVLYFAESLAHYYYYAFYRSHFTLGGPQPVVRLAVGDVFCMLWMTMLLVCGYLDSLNARTVVVGIIVDVGRYGIFTDKEFACVDSKWNADLDLVIVCAALERHRYRRSHRNLKLQDAIL